MKNKITSIIMFLVSLGIFAVIIIFIMIFFQEFEIGVDKNFYTEALEVSNREEEVNNSEEKTIENNIETPQIIENPIGSLQPTNSSEEKFDYNMYIDKYFYNQLEEYSKIIYRAFESNKEEMKTGVKQINLGTSFNSLLNQVNGQELLGNYYQSAIEAYTYDNPEVFYLSPNKMYLNIETTTRGNSKSYRVFINNGNENNYLIDEFTSKEQIDSAMTQINQIRNEVISKKTGNSYQDIKMVHDYLVDNLSYDTSISKPNIYNIYGAMVSKVCVCEGYARAFKYMLDGLNIPCTLVIGKGVNSEGKTENHAWNYVQLDGVWYAVDCTWDDPIVSGGGTPSPSSKYRYFLKGSNTMNNDHVPNGQFTENGKVFDYPKISMNDYR